MARRLAGMLLYRWDPGSEHHLISGFLGMLDRCIRALATVSLALLIVIIFSNVVARYVFGHSLVWAQEAGIWLFIYIIFLGIPLAHRARSHLSLTLFVDMLPVSVRRVTDLLGDVVIAYVTIMLFLAGLDVMERIGGVSPALGVPIGVKYMLIPLSCAVSLVYILFRGTEGNWPLWHGPVAVALGVLLYFVVNEWYLVDLPTQSATLVMSLSFAAGLMLGIPVAFAMLFGVFISSLGVMVLPPVALVQNIVNGAGKFLLLAIPFFLTAGTLMNAGGLSRRLMDFAFSLVGHLRGGHAQVSVVSSLLYGGISGSSYSEAALSSKLLVPQMIRHGYSAPFACAVTASSGILPNVVPPSIALLIVAAVANLSVSSLWLAGIGAGLVLTLCLMVAVYVLARWHGHGAANTRAPLSDMAIRGVHAIPVLILAVIILGGIRFGIVTPTEAGVLAVVYSLFLGMVIYREYGVSGLLEALHVSAKEAAMVGLLIASAAPFAFILVVEQVPQTMVAVFTANIDSVVLMLIIVNVIILFFGMFLDIGAAILILTPLLMPVGLAMGVDPIHFSLIIVVNLMIGGVTPPVGMLAFITSAVTGTPVHQIFRAIMPFLVALLVALMIITYVPDVTIGILELF